MAFVNLRSLRSRLLDASRNASRKTPARERPISRLGVERLEERCLLSYTITDLGGFPQSYQSFAYAINNQGQVVGEAPTPPRAHQAVVWEGGAMTPLGTLDYATDINDRG